MNRFQRESRCVAFLATNAGATGLNLQAANTVINVDLPWNPAVLEQRIGRAHRMGQSRPVHVYILVTEGTFEENMLGTITAKKDLAMAALDPESKVKEVALQGNIEELRHRLEILVGEKSMPIDQSEAVRVKESAAAFQTSRREIVARAGGELVTAAFRFMGERLAAPVGEGNGGSTSNHTPPR